MLFLDRRPGERVKIGEDVWVTCVGLRRGKMRIGIDAPKHLRIVREEIAGTPHPDHAGSDPQTETGGTP